MKLNPYTNRVLAVVKAKYDLRDKSEALNKFVEEHGVEEMEREVKESYIRKLDAIEKDYFMKHGTGKSMTAKELDELFGK